MSGRGRRGTRFPGPSSARNPRLMRLDTAARMADALGVTLDDFWNGL